MTTRTRISTLSARSVPTTVAKASVRLPANWRCSTSHGNPQTRATRRRSAPSMRVSRASAKIGASPPLSKDSNPGRCFYVTGRTSWVARPSGSIRKPAIGTGKTASKRHPLAQFAGLTA